MSDTSARALFAARLIQARQLRGLSQRALGDRMGLGKEKGSSRINRYEHQVTAIGFDNLETLAKVLEVPVAYLLADNAAMASAILALAESPENRQNDIAAIIQALSQDPTLLRRVLDALMASQTGSAASKSPREAPKPSARKAKRGKGEG